MNVGEKLFIDVSFENSEDTLAGSSKYPCDPELDLTFDDRQANGILNMPGVPVAVDHPTGYLIVAWREVAVPEQFAVLEAGERSGGRVWAQLADEAEGDAREAMLACTKPEVENADALRAILATL